NAEKSPRRDPTASGKRDAAVNRLASHNYFLLEKFEAGIALTGTEVKSIRGGRANLKDAYGLVKDGEIWLLNAHISPYEHGSYSNHEALRTRKLLMHREEITKLIGKTQQKGLTLIPTRMYFKNGRVKVRSEEHTSELQSLAYLVCRLLLEKKKQNKNKNKLKDN